MKINSVTDLLQISSWNWGQACKRSHLGYKVEWYTLRQRSVANWHSEVRWLTCDDSVPRCEATVWTEISQVCALPYCAASHRNVIALTSPYWAPTHTAIWFSNSFRIKVTERALDWHPEIPYFFCVRKL